MLRSALAVVVTSTTLLSASVAVGQDSENPPTFSQRFDRFRKNLFGGDKDETIVAAPPARAGGRAPTNKPRPTGQSARNPQAGSRANAGAPPQNAPEAGPADTARAPRSSRRTFQPGYEPSPRQAMAQPADEPVSEMPQSSQVAEMEESQPVETPTTKTHTAYAGPKSTASKAPAANEPFEPSLEDRTLPATGGVTKRTAEIGKSGPERVAKSVPEESTAADVADELPKISSAKEESLAAKLDAANTTTTKSAPRTLEERLAAARTQQKAKTIRPAVEKKAPTAPAKPQTVEVATPAPAAVDPAAAEPVVAKKASKASQGEESSEQLAAHAAKSDPEVSIEPAKAAVSEEAAPVHRLARADKPAPKLPEAKTAEVKTPEATPVAEGLATSTPDDAVLFKQQSPVLSVETSGPRKIKIGSPAAYGVTMQNTGNVAAKDVVVSVKLPEWAEVAAATPRVGSARTVTLDGAAVLQWIIPSLDAKSRAELSLSVVPRKSRPFDLAVTWTHTPEISQASVEVQEPKLLMNLAGPDEIYFGEREVYKLTLSNPGTGEAENVVVRLLPTSAGDEQAVSHPIGNIAAGESKVVELELTAKQANTLEIKAEAVADGDLHSSIDEVIIVRRPELEVAVQGPRKQYAGTPATYKVRVTNPGNATAKNVQVAALLPRNASYLSSSDGGTVDGDQRKVTWTIGNLRAGADVTMAFKCLLTNPGGNTAQVACHADGDIRNQGAATTEVEALADLTLKIIDPQGPVPVGQEITYEVHVTNRGTKAADNVEIMAFFSPGIEPVAVDQGNHEISAGQIAFAPVARIEAGQELVYRIRARADRAANHVFRAEVACPTLETKLSADETTRFYVDDSLEPDEAAATAEPAATEDASQEAVDADVEVESAPVETEGDVDGAGKETVPQDLEEPQPE